MDNERENMDELLKEKLKLIQYRDQAWAHFRDELPMLHDLGRNPETVRELMEHTDYATSLLQSLCGLVATEILINEMDEEQDDDESGSVQEPS